MARLLPGSGRRHPRSSAPGGRGRPAGVLLLSAGVAAVVARLQGVSFVPTAGPLPLSGRQPCTGQRCPAVAVAAEESASLQVASLHVGQEVEGTVTNLIKLGAFVDIGAERPGLVPRNKLSQGFTANVADVVKAGDKVTAWVSEASPEKLILSLVKEKAPRDLSAFQGIDAAEWLTGTVARIEPFGAFVAVKAPAGAEQETQGLVHTSKMAPETELEVGQEVKVRVIDVDVAKGNLGFSMLEESGEEAEEAPGADFSLFEGVDGGEWLTGTVDSVSPFGAFVMVTPPGSDAPAKGLVHKTEISKDFVADATEAVSVGQEVKVRVLAVDPAQSKLALSMVDNAKAESTVDLAPFQEVGSGEWLPAKVAKFASFGMFVDVRLPNDAGEAQGLVHITEIRDGFVTDPSEEAEIGQDVQVRVLNVDPAAGKLGLSMKKATKEDKGSSIKRPPADLSLFEDVDSSEWLTGHVASTASFGAFVDVTPPNGGFTAAQGLVHITQIREGFVSDVSEEVEVGAEVKVRVLKVDAANGKLSLSMKGEQSLRREELVPFESVPEDAWLTGKIIAIKNFGALVEVEPPTGGSPGMGMVHISQISDDHVEDVGEVLEVDQSIQVRVLSVDVEIGRLSLSMRERQAEEPAEAETAEPAEPAETELAA